MGRGMVLGAGKKDAGWLPSRCWAEPLPPEGRVPAAVRKALISTTAFLCLDVDKYTRIFSGTFSPNLETDNR